VTGDERQRFPWPIPTIKRMKEFSVASYIVVDSLYVYIGADEFEDNFDSSRDF
jgi:hypothetical protein